MEDGEGNILNIGRKSRTVPPAMRRALNIRDQHCKFPGCCESRFVDAHHIKHWCEGGETSLDNLVLLCRRHHRLLHAQGYRIEKRSNGDFTFLKPDGLVMPNAMTPQFEYREYGLDDFPPIDANTVGTTWQGERMDYDLSVAVLVDKEKCSMPAAI